MQIDGLEREQLVALKETTERELKAAERALVLNHVIPAWEMTERAGRRLGLRRRLYAIDERLARMAPVAAALSWASS